MDGLVTPGTKVPAQAFALPRPLTNSGTDSHEHVSDSLGVIHHDSLHGSIQHPDLQGSLFLPVLHGVLLEQGNAGPFKLILFIAKEKGRLWWLSQKEGALTVCHRESHGHAKGSGTWYMQSPGLGEGTGIREE